MGTMSVPIRSAWQRYGLALLLVALATGISFALWSVVRPVPLFFFVLAVLVSVAQADEFLRTTCRQRAHGKETAIEIVLDTQLQQAIVALSQVRRLGCEPARRKTANGGSPRLQTTDFRLQVHPLVPLFNLQSAISNLK